MGIAVVPGGLGAVIHGEVTEEWARHHHPLWLSRISSNAERRR
jgi:cytochrome b subunit of formate dehydrogenase